MCAKEIERRSIIKEKLMVGGGTHHSFDVTSAVDNIRSEDLYDGKTNRIC